MIWPECLKKNPFSEFFLPCSDCDAWQKYKCEKRIKYYAFQVVVKIVLVPGSVFIWSVFLSLPLSPYGKYKYINTSALTPNPDNVRLSLIDVVEVCLSWRLQRGRLQIKHRHNLRGPGGLLAGPNAIQHNSFNKQLYLVPPPWIQGGELVWSCCDEMPEEYLWEASRADFESSPVLSSLSSKWVSESDCLCLVLSVKMVVYVRVEMFAWELKEKRTGSLYFHLPSNDWGWERQDSSLLQRGWFF